MKFACRCGAIVLDQTDALPHKAHIIPDQVWFDLLDTIDHAIEASGPDASARQAACMRVRAAFSTRARPAWQCGSCQRLYIQDATRLVHEYAPAASHPSHNPERLFQSTR